MRFYLLFFISYAFLMMSEAYCGDNSDVEILPGCYVHNDQKTRISEINFLDEVNNVYNIKSFEGQVVIFYFWASWCLECIKDIQKLDSLKAKLLYHNINDVEIIPISSDFKRVDHLISIYKEIKIKNLGLFFDHNKAIAKLLRIENLPRAIILSKNLIKVCEFSNKINWDHEDIVDKIIMLRGGPVRNYQDIEAIEPHLEK